MSGKTSIVKKRLPTDELFQEPIDLGSFTEHFATDILSQITTILD